MYNLNINGKGGRHIQDNAGDLPLKKVFSSSTMAASCELLMPIGGWFSILLSRGTKAICRHFPECG